MPRKTILVFIDWYLPGFKAGGPITSCSNVVEHLRDEFDFRIVTRDTDYTDSSPYSGIVSNTWIRLADGTPVYYFSKEQLTRKNISRLISETPCSVVYLNGIYSRYFTVIPLLLLKKHAGVRVVVAVRGMLAQSALNVKKIKKTAFLMFVKRMRLFRQVIFHASTEIEKRDIERVFGRLNTVSVAPNLASVSIPGVNPQRFKTSGELSLISIARIAPEKNLLFALHILLGLKGLKITFDIYGPIYDTEYWKQCTDLIALMPSSIVIRYLGSIENNKVQETLANYQFLWMPTQGENFGHIILQAFSAGCPVIISNKTPWTGLRNMNCGWDLGLDNDAAFQDAIREAIDMNQQQFNLLSEHSFRFALRYLSDKENEEANRKLFR